MGRSVRVCGPGSWSELVHHPSRCLVPPRGRPAPGPMSLHSPAPGSLEVRGARGGQPGQPRTQQGARCSRGPSPGLEDSPVPGQPTPWAPRSQAGPG